MIFLDLADALSTCTERDVASRAQEFIEDYNGIYLIAVGGFPLTEHRREFFWCGSPLSVERLASEIKRGLGLSGMLTYMNKNRLSLEGLGDICQERQHDWAHHWMSLSILFSGFSPSVELAFARDTRFKLSWPVMPEGKGMAKLFVANGSLHSWTRFSANHTSKDFDEMTRKVLSATHRWIAELLDEAD